MCQPAAGYSESAVLMAYARSPTTSDRRSASRVVSVSSWTAADGGPGGLGGFGLVRGGGVDHRDDQRGGEGRSCDQAGGSGGTNHDRGSLQQKS